MDILLVERDDGVVTLTMNRPERRNALDVPSWQMLTRELQAISANEKDRVVVLTGADGSFCAGGDLSGGGAEGSGGESALEVMRATVTAFCTTLHHLPKPTIAAVEGSAAGAGANLAFACDLVVAAESARFSEIFIRRALSIDSGGSWLLPRLVGLQKAKELAFFGDWVSAPEAQRLGLVNRVVADGASLEESRAWAARLVGFSGIALRHTKAALNDAFGSSLEQSLEREARGIFECSQTAEFRASVRELLGRRAK